MNLLFNYLPRILKECGEVTKDKKVENSNEASDF